MYSIVSPDMLAGQPEIYFGNPDWNIEWLGTVDRHRYPAYHTDLRTLSVTISPQTT
jgi:hypothetical protein